MVASRSRIHGFDDVQLSSSKSVVRYDGNNPASVRQFGLIIRAVMEEKGVLDAVISADQSFDEWLRASGDYSKKDKESLEAYAEYKEEVRVKRKRAYTVMLQWPGVLNPRIMDKVKPFVNYAAAHREALAKGAAKKLGAKMGRVVPIRNSLGREGPKAAAAAAEEAEMQQVMAQLLRQYLPSQF